MLTILSHLLRGESVIENYLKSNESSSSSSSVNATNSGTTVNIASTSGTSSASSSGSTAALAFALSAPTVDVSQPRVVAEGAPPEASADDDLPEGAGEFITALTDMGFTREMALEALMNVGHDVVAATEWMLSQPDRAQVRKIILNGVKC